MTEEEALALVIRVLGGRRPVTLRPFEFGWIVREELTQQEREHGRGLGMARVIVDRDGTMTRHPSMPPLEMLDEYVAARREGRYTGRRIWPTPVE